MFFLCFFFNDTATTEIYTLSLHDALPIWIVLQVGGDLVGSGRWDLEQDGRVTRATYLWAVRTTKRWMNLLADRKSTRLNSSHLVISYAVFCLKKKNALTYV